MSLLLIDGFDHYTHQSFGGKWDAQPSTSGTPGRTGRYMGFGSGGPFFKLIPVPGDWFILGAAFQWQGASLPLGVQFVYFSEGAINHVTFGLSASAALTVSRAGTLIATATNATLVVNNWYYIEFKVVIHDTTGSIEVKLDGTTVTWNATVTNIDTRVAGTGIVDKFGFSGTAVGPYTMVDDLYLVDDAGAAPRNTYLGAVRVETLLPQTDAVAAGSNAGLTPSTGTDHGALVDDPAPPNTTDYNSSTTVGVKDTYNFPSLTLTGAVLGVQTSLYVAKSDAGPKSVCAVVRAGGVDYDGATVAPLTTFQYFGELRAQNPNTSLDWTIADIAALQAGMKIVT